MPIIEFEGLSENLIPGIQQLTDSTIKLRTETVATNEAMKKGAAENIAAQQKLGQVIDVTADTMTALNQAQAQSAQSAAQVGAQATRAEGPVRRLATSIANFGRGARDGFRQAISEAGGVRGVLTQLGQRFGVLSRETKRSIDTSRKSIADLRKDLDALSRSRDALIDPKAIAKTNADIAKVNERIKTLQTSLPQSGGVIGGAFRSISGAISQVTSQIPLIGGFASALGPVGLAASAVAGGLLSIVKNTDAGATALDGLSRSAGITFDKITGAVTRFTNELGNSTVFGSKLSDVIKDIGDSITSISTAGVFDLIKNSLADAADEGQRLAEAYDRITDKQIALTVTNAKEEREVNKLNIQLRDRTKTEQERLAIAEKLTALEKGRAGREVAVQKEITAALKQEAAQQLRDKNEVDDELKQRLADSLAAEQRTLQESESIIERAQNRQNAIREEGAAERQQIADKEKQELEKNLTELARLEEDLARRSNAARLQGADDPIAKLNEERRQADAEVAILEKKIRDQNAILGQGANLTAEQEQQLANLRIAIQIKYDQDRQAIELAAAESRLALITDSGEREIAAFEINLKKSIESLEKASATYDELVRFEEARRAEFAVKQTQAAIDTEEKIALAKIGAIQQGAETEAEYRLRIELLKLQTQESFTQRRLDAIKDDSSKEAAVLRASLEEVLAEIERKRAELQNNAPKFDLFKALGLNLDPEQKAQLISDLRTIGQAIQQTIQANIQAQQASVEAQISATESIISDAQSRREGLEQELERSLEDQRRGYATNQEIIQDSIERTRAEERNAIAEKRRLLQEQKRLAKQAIAIDAASQASGMILSAVNLIKTWSSLPYGVGLAAAAAQIAGLIAFVASIRARVKAVDSQSFRKGGELKGPRHEVDGSGGIAMMDRRTGHQIAWAEGGEYVVNRDRTVRYRDLIESVNEGSMAQVHKAALAELQRAGVVSPSKKVVREIVSAKERVETMIIERGAPDQALLREMRALREEVAMFRSENKGRPTETTDKGRPVMKTPNMTVKRR